MPNARRHLDAQVRRDLGRKMVFVAGPRRVGETTLAQGLPYTKRDYLNYDVAHDRERILKRELPAAPLWVFDSSQVPSVAQLYEGRL